MGTLVTEDRTGWSQRPGYGGGTGPSMVVVDARQGGGECPGTVVAKARHGGGGCPSMVQVDARALYQQRPGGDGGLGRVAAEAQA